MQCNSVGGQNAFIKKNYLSSKGDFYSMKKLLTTLLMLVGVATFAGVERPFVQFARTDYTSEQRPADLNASQNTTNNGDWYPAQLISLHVYAGTSVWLTHKVQSWYEPLNLDGNEYGNEFDMLGGDHRYGYIFKDDFNGDLTMEKGTYDNLIHWADGTTDLITYVNDANEAIKSTRTGYFLDHFDEGAEIYLVMTTLPEDGGETVDSYQYVQSDNHGATTLMSRTYDYDDLAGNVVINFGIDNGTYGDGVGIGREFVAVYDKGDDGIGGGGTGGPLPGAFFAGLLSLGTVFGASKVKRQKRA